MSLFYARFLSGGEIFISVPDIEILSEMVSRKGLGKTGKTLLMPIIFGGQEHEANFHKMGFYFGYLEELLEAFDFCDIKRVENFGYFYDTSRMTLDIGYGIEPFSLNVKARRCLPEESSGPILGCPCFISNDKNCFMIAYDYE